MPITEVMEELERAEANFKLAFGERGQYLPVDEWDRRFGVFCRWVAAYGFGEALRRLYAGEGSY